MGFKGGRRRRMYAPFLERETLKADTWTAVSRLKQAKRKSLFSLEAPSHALMSSQFSQEKEWSQTLKQFFSQYFVLSVTERRSHPVRQSTSQHSSQWRGAQLVLSILMLSPVLMSWELDEPICSNADLHWIHRGISEETASTSLYILWRS